MPGKGAAATPSDVREAKSSLKNYVYVVSMRFDVSANRYNISSMEHNAQYRIVETWASCNIYIVRLLLVKIGRMRWMKMVGISNAEYFSFYTDVNMKRFYRNLLCWVLSAVPCPYLSISMCIMHCTSKICSSMKNDWAEDIHVCRFYWWKRCISEKLISKNYLEFTKSYIRRPFTGQ